MCNIEGVSALLLPLSSNDYLLFDSIEVNDNTIGEYVYLSAFCVLDYSNSRHYFVQNILLSIQGTPIKFLVFLYYYNL